MPRYYIFGGYRIDDQFSSLIMVSDTWCLNWAFGIQPGGGAWVCPSGATSSSLSLLMQLQFTVKGSAFPPSSDATSDRWMALVTEFIPARKTSKSEHRKVISRKLHTCRWPFFFFFVPKPPDFLNGAMWMQFPLQKGIIGITAWTDFHQPWKYMTGRSFRYTEERDVTPCVERDKWIKHQASSFVLRIRSRTA